MPQTGDEELPPGTKIEIRQADNPEDSTVAVCGDNGTGRGTETSKAELAESVMISHTSTDPD
ncbi:hypothetical protein DOS78_11220 [Staphylococcus felis]|uniref:hypothetical protein n=1 Tax=Staphylococcus felis TaxID=46127 RepID=UPI000E26B76F|nr:hypothetical protein [Staphylococcus felis]REI20610.1 hypothetical protein DOS78_11220 [Staphylococcus felis]